MITRGIRNNNPFNIKKSANSWKGKLMPSKDPVFEQFKSMELGLRAGFRLLQNYLRKDIRSVDAIIRRFAPASENNVSKYIDFVCQDTTLLPETVIEINSLTFFWLCQRILRYESDFILEYHVYKSIRSKYHI